MYGMCEFCLKSVKYKKNAAIGLNCFLIQIATPAAALFSSGRSTKHCHVLDVNKQLLM
jgi:hypothetical protein